MLFRAAIKEHTVEEQDDNSFVVPYTDEVYTPNGWVRVKELKAGDSILVDDVVSCISDVRVDENNNYIIKM